MEQDVTSRVEHLLSEFNLNASAFADGIQIPRAVMSHILSRRNKPSLDVVQKILKKFPQVSSDWLLNGIGNMIQLNIFENEKHQPNPPEPDTRNSVLAAKENFAAPKIVAADPPVAPALTIKEVPEISVPESAPNATAPQSIENILSASTVPEKKIEKIVFFYTDKSFSVHLPE